MARGRPRKSGPRKNGRLIIPVDHGTERTQAMQAIYGHDGCDAIGRAYRAGLLGEGSEAKALLDTARAIANAYWTAFEVGPFTCALAERTHGNVEPIDAEKVKRREQWLTESLRTVDRMGVRKAFDALVINVNPDHGPAFLDRLIYARRQHMPEPLADRRVLRAALDALEMLAG